MKEAFRRFAKAAADAVGSPAAFLLGVLGVLVWLATGPYCHYSDTWQLIVNSGTSVGAFLVVFLIQNTQSRETKVMQLKLDELIRAQKHARTELVQMESCTDDELEELQKEFLQHSNEAITSLERIEQSRRRRIERTAIITPDEMPRS